VSDDLAAPIAVTTGEPAGIGPEIALKAASRLTVADPTARVVLLGDGSLLRQVGAVAAPDMPIVDFEFGPRPQGPALEVLHIPLAAPVTPGVLDARNAASVLAMLDAAIDGTAARRFAALVTAPVQKSVINDAGVAFSGHTEYLAARTGARHVVMMLAGGGLRVALATTHVALSEVSKAISAAGLDATLGVLCADLKHYFGLAQARILVCGLNPHAGENGYLGREEIDIIAPAIARARQAGLDVRGPFPADTLFQPKYLDSADAVLAMYHDQGLPVLKYASFGRGVNITLGLPFIRTSVDHGTALDLAGQGKADAGSMDAALSMAIFMARASALA
jgi:4-hydroxythreonine-4-phosphate dehydrogenase